ncbi:MAG: alcohol dehydrogenase catalytic domain-containing protein [Gaiella sp.]
MRAIVLDSHGRPRMAEVDEPDGEGSPLEVLACGLCGSDVEKLSAAHAGVVLGHEVAARTGDGKLVAPIHHAPCGECALCTAGHESLCPDFGALTILPGGFAERVSATAGWVEIPDGVTPAVATMTEPLACVLRGVRLVPRGSVLIVGHGFVGHLFAAVLRHRGDEVYAVDTDPRRHLSEPVGPVDAAILCGAGGADLAFRWTRPGGTILVFANAGPIPAAPVYRGELTVVGVRSSSPETMREAASLLSVLRLPEPAVLPLERFREGLDLFRRHEVLKVVFTP